MFMKETKLIQTKQAYAGQKFRAIHERDGRRVDYFTGFVKKVTPAYLEYERSRSDGETERCSASVLLEVEMAKEEIWEKYKEDCAKIYRGIQNRLAGYEIGSHELNNSWISDDMSKMAAGLRKMGAEVIGHSRDITAKTPLFSDELLDVAIVCERPDGSRFWCHTSSRLYERLLDSCRKNCAGVTADNT